MNDPESLNHTNQRTRLALSVGMVDGIQKLEIKNKSYGEKEGLYPILQEAIEMYTRDKTGQIYFTKNHMKAIFLFSFDVTPKNGKKADWLIQLEKLDEDDTEKNI